MLDFAADHQNLRDDVLNRIESIRPIIEANAEASQLGREMPEASWRAMNDAGLFGLKAPAELGGLDADAVIQIEAIERMAYYDGSAGWTMMVGLGASAMAAGWVQDDALDLLRAGDRLRRGALCLAPTGKAVVVEGGYRISGRWAFGSGSHHAEWIVVTAIVEDGDHPGVQSFLLEAGDVLIEDTWHTTGLKGTGSSHMTVSDAFVEERRRLAPAFGPPLRGSAVLRMGQPGLVVCEHAAIALGIARRMIDEIAEIARRKARGITVKKSIAQSEHFQFELGQAEIRLRAAREYVLRAFERAHRDVETGHELATDRQLELRLAGVHATDTAYEICNRLARHAGTTALYSGNAIERCLRDIHAAAQHHLIAQGGYAVQGRLMLGEEVTALD